MLKLRFFGPVKNYTKGVSEIIINVKGNIKVIELIRSIDKRYGWSLESLIVERSNNEFNVTILSNIGILKLEDIITHKVREIAILPPASGG